MATVGFVGVAVSKEKKIQSVFVMAKAVVSLADPEVFCSCNVVLYPVL